MAASQAPTALSYPGQNSPDPFSAKFYETQAALQFSEENSLKASEKAERLANNQYTYANSLNTRQVPIALLRNRNSANSQGLAESGILARTQGQTQTQFAEKGARLSEARKNAIDRAQEAAFNAKADYALKTNANVRGEEEHQREEAINHPPKPIGSTPANPGGERTVEGPPGAGGVVPYSETSPRGSVRVGAGIPAGAGSFKSTPGGSVAVGSATRAAREARERAAKKAMVG